MNAKKSKKSDKEFVESKHQIDERTWRSRAEIVASVLGELKEIGVADASTDFTDHEMQLFSFSSDGGVVYARFSTFQLGSWPFVTRTPYHELEIHGTRRQTFSPTCECGRDGSEKRIALFVKAPNVRKIAEKIHRELGISCDERQAQHSLDVKRGKMIETAKTVNKQAGAKVIGVSGQGKFVVGFRRDLSAEDVARIANAEIADLLAVRSSWELE